MSTVLHNPAAPRYVGLIRWTLIAILLLVVTQIAVELRTYPTVISTAGSQGGVYLILLISAVLIYGGLTLLGTRATSGSARIALQQGIGWGIACGAAWALELLTANVVNPQTSGLYPLLYFGTTMAGFLLPGAAAMLTARRTQAIGSAVRAGLLCGICGGLLIFLASFLFSALFFQAGQIDPQTIREFQQSGVPDLGTYISGDYLAGMIAHLWIGLITGGILGLVGGIIGRTTTYQQGT